MGKSRKTKAELEKEIAALKVENAEVEAHWSDKVQGYEARWKAHDLVARRETLMRLEMQARFGDSEYRKRGESEMPENGLVRAAMALGQREADLYQDSQKRGDYEVFRVLNEHPAKRLSTLI